MLRLSIDRRLTRKVVLHCFKQCVQVTTLGIRGEENNLWDQKHDRCMMATYLALALPIENIFDLALTTWVYELSGPNKHVTCGDDIGYRRETRIFSCEP